MSKIYSPEDFSTEKKDLFNPELWTAVVPMAGRGTRLNYDKPKALYPILGKSILAWMVSGLERNCGEIILVVSPEGKVSLESEVAKIKSPAKIRMTVQQCPRGMADAVFCAREFVKTANTVVVWGDQVTLSRQTLAFCQHLLEKNKASLSLPTYVRKDPYICLDRDTDGRIIRVRQKREGEIKDLKGENDCGVFCFSTKDLFDVLEKEKSVGSETNEFNLLPLLPHFDSKGRTSATLRIQSEDETLGINTVEDARNVEKILSKR